MAPFTDGGRADRSHQLAEHAYISYYPFGGAIALALDLTLRERSDSRITLDDFMRAMWRVHGKPGGSARGLRRSSVHDGRRRSAAGGGERRRARSRAISSTATFSGREVADYARLLAAGRLRGPQARPGPRVVGRRPHRAARRTAARVGAVVPANSPAYAAGLDQDDTVTQIAGERVTSAEAVNTVISRHRPGERVTIAVHRPHRRDGTSSLVLAENPHVDVAAVESAGGSLSYAQRAFRDRWLKSQQ